MLHRLVATVPLLLALACLLAPLASGRAADQAQFPPKIGSTSKQGQTATSQEQPAESPGDSASQPASDDSAKPAQKSKQDKDAASPSGGASGATMERIPGLATPSPYDPDDTKYDKPFSLSPLRAYKPQRGALTTVERNATSPSEITVQASACDQLSSAQGKGSDLESFKKHLVDLARDKAAFLISTRMYAGQSQVGVQDNLPPHYQQALADKLQVTGKPSFYNGDVFGQLCAKITASLPGQHVDTAAPLIATLQNFCFQAPDTSESELEAKAKQAALQRIVQNIAPGAVLPAGLQQRLLQEATVSGQLGGAHDDVYCLNMHLEVSPLELLPHVPTAKSRKKAPGAPQTLAQRLDPTWSLDLSGYQPGQPAPEYGKNLVVYQDANGKSLGPNSKEGALAILPATSAPDFSLRVLVSRQFSWNFLYSRTVEFFRLHFANKAWEQAAFVMSMSDKNTPVAYYQSRTSSSATFPWDMAVNFNDCYLVKQGKQMRFFFNGTFVLAYPTDGTSLTQVRVPLEWNDRLYNVLVKDLGK